MSRLKKKQWAAPIPLLNFNLKLQLKWTKSIPLFNLDFKLRLTSKLPHSKRTHSPTLNWTKPNISLAPLEGEGIELMEEPSVFRAHNHLGNAVVVEIHYGRA